MNIILLDDHRTFRDSFRIAVWQEAAIGVIGEAATAREGIPMVEAQRPDLLVADLMLSDTDGISLVRELRRRGDHTKVMLLTAHANGLFVRDAFDAGVTGYALKEQSLGEIVEAMKKSAAGERYVAPQLGPLQATVRQGGNGDHAGLDQLSRREREIFGRIIQGLSSRDIAQTLCISLKTVETHRSHINRKLGVHSPAELIRLAALKGLLATTPTSLPMDGASSDGSSANIPAA
jgi:DNA-binding NarL/FixJ family response regulator